MTEPVSRRIPPAEATEYPWWVIIDPARAMLPHPEDVGGFGPCDVCGAADDDPCVQAEDEDSPGELRREWHENGRHDYRDEVSAEDLALVMTGPFFSRGAAAAYLREKAHRFSSRARVWCASGHESGDWRALCAGLPVEGRDEEIARLRRELAVECGDVSAALDGWRAVSESVWAHESGVHIVRRHGDARSVWLAYRPGAGLAGPMIATRSTRIDGEWPTAFQAMEAMAQRGAGEGACCST